MIETDAKPNPLSTMRFDRDEVDRALRFISAWDFTLTKRKLLEPEYCGWPEERIESAEKSYKRFLALTKAMPQYPIVPSRDLDRFWHEHILDTRRYERDCFALFGSFLHHNPFYGMNGLEEEIEWKATAFESNLIWREAFGEELYDAKAIDPDSAVRHCRSHCIPSASTIAACNRPHCRGHCIP